MVSKPANTVFEHSVLSGGAALIRADKRAHSGF